MRDTYRSLGAMTGLGLMWLLGLGGIVLAAIFGACGTVVGGMSGERMADRRGRLQ